MRGNTKSKMLLLELLLSVLIFSFCITICAGVFYQASITARNSRDLSSAVYTAQIAAESFNAVDDIDELCLLLGGKLVGGICRVAFDEDWQTYPTEDPGFWDARFYMEVYISLYGMVSVADIHIVYGDGSPVYQLSSTKYLPEVVR